MTAPRSDSRRSLASFSLPSEHGNERRAMEKVTYRTTAKMVTAQPPKKPTKKKPNALLRSNYYSLGHLIHSTAQKTHSARSASSILTSFA